MRLFVRWDSRSDGEKADFIWCLFKWFLVLSIVNTLFGLIVNGLMWKVYA